MSNYLKFICPECGGKTIEEVLVNATVLSVIYVDEAGDAFYGEQENRDGEVSHFQCHRCGKTIRAGTKGSPVDQRDNLVEWLLSQSYNIPSVEKDIDSK